MKKDLEKLAIEGGTPVRTTPLPWELPGAHWMGQEELDLVARVIKTTSAAAPKHLAGMSAGWCQSLDRLSELVVLV